MTSVSRMIRKVKLTREKSTVTKIKIIDLPQSVISDILNVYVTGPVMRLRCRQVCRIFLDSVDFRSDKRLDVPAEYPGLFDVFLRKVQPESIRLSIINAPELFTSTHQLICLSSSAPNLSQLSIGCFPLPDTVGHILQREDHDWGDMTILPRNLKHFSCCHIDLKAFRILTMDGHFRIDYPTLLFNAGIEFLEFNFDHYASNAYLYLRWDLCKTIRARSLRRIIVNFNHNMKQDHQLVAWDLLMSPDHQLESLSVDHAQLVDVSEHKDVYILDKLKHLQLHFCELAGDNWTKIAAPMLTHLDIEYSSHSRNNAPKDFFSNMTSIEDLQLNGTRFVTPELFRAVLFGSSLSRLDLSQSDAASNAGLEALARARLPSLKCLAADNTDTISDYAVEIFLIAHCGLEKLSLVGHCTLSSAIVPLLVQIGLSLKYVDLRRTGCKNSKSVFTQSVKSIMAERGLTIDVSPRWNRLQEILTL